MERPEVMQIMDEMLRDLHLDNHYDMFIREHNPLDGTHKESKAILIRGPGKVISCLVQPDIGSKYRVCGRSVKNSD